MTNITSNLKHFCHFLSLTLPVALLIGFLPVHCLADPTQQIFLSEGGILVDESANYSYSEQHLIGLATQQVVGYPSPLGLVPIINANAQVIGYTLVLVNADNQEIGYILYSN